MSPAAEDRKSRLGAAHGYLLHKAWPMGLGNESTVEEEDLANRHCASLCPVWPKATNRSMNRERRGVWSRGNIGGRGLP
jgi:hypothetical protein